MSKEPTLTHLDKIFWPKEGYTKGDVLAYYDKVAPYILPHLKDRPMSLNRHPDGITGEHFFQKNVEEHPSWVKIYVQHSKAKNKLVHWVICNDRQTLLYLANLGCIELNPWNSRYQKPDYPDYLILDLDPHQISFSQVIVTAKEIKHLLDETRIEAFLKTSGIHGLHILIPLGAKYRYAQARQFGEVLAKAINDKLPAITSIVRDPQKRHRKIYLDYLQNSKGQTLAAPYSLRPVAGASVATPLDWSELKPSLGISDFNLKTILPRLKTKGDVWKDLLTHKGIDILACLDRLAKVS